MDCALNMTNKKKKIITWLSRVLIILFAVFVLALPSADAKKKKIGLGDEDCLQTTVEWVLDILTGPFDPIIQTVNGEGVFGQLYEMINDLTYGVGGTQSTGTFRTIVNPFYKTLQFLGFTWALVIAVMRMFQNLDRGGDPVETVLKVFIEYCVVGIILANFYTVMKVVRDFGEFILDQALAVVNVGGDSTDYTEMAINTVYNMIHMTPGSELTLIDQVTKPIGLFMTLLLPWVCSVIVKVLAQFLVLQIIIEMGIRRTFAPLAVSDIYAEGLRSPGARYLKKYLATWLKLAVCVITVIIGNFIIEAAILGMTSSDNITLASMFVLVAGQFSIIGVMMKGGEYTNDIMGV